MEVKSLFFLNKNLELYRPNEIALNVSMVPFAELAHSGITNAIIDLDGTLCSKKNNQIDEIARQLLILRKKEGKLDNICVVSNLVYRNQDRETRLSNVSSQIDASHIAAYWPNLKPKPNRFIQTIIRLLAIQQSEPNPYLRAMELMESTPQNTFVIGDQLLTDIYGGNLLGLHTILVPSLSDSDHLITRPKRLIEKQILKHLGITLSMP